jgi:hypothetical protein
MQQARSRMEQIAEVTGGHVAFPTKPAEVAPLYEEIARVRCVELWPVVFTDDRE